MLGRNQSGKAITLQLLSLAEHEEYIVARGTSASKTWSPQTPWR